MAPRALVLVLAVATAACGGASGPPAAPTEVVAVRRGAVALDPGSSVWEEVPPFTAALIPQDMVEPRLVVPSTPEVRVKAMSDGTRLAFRLEWSDATRDDLPGVSTFSDACAVQLPATIEPDVPAPQMGEPGKPIEISYWRAFWQSTVDGRADTIAALYPNAAVDHYPFEAPSLAEGSPEQREMARRYAPARALGNAMAGPRAKPVEDLVGDGPGTLRPGKPETDGGGTRGPSGWAVVLARPIPPGLAPGGRGQVAFAIWDGAHEEAGARKMRTAWVPLHLEGTR
jgi:hypothetical protein